MALRGINYGHQFTAATYSSAVVESDLRIMWRCGFRVLRVAYPPFDTPAATMNFCKDIVLRALGYGFKVIWGVVSSGTTVNAVRWSNFLNHVGATLAPWAQTIGNSNLQLSMGNEEELHVDGVTVSVAQCQADIRALATSCQAVYAAGPIDYVCDALQRNAWQASGLGDLDYIGFNVYFQWAPTEAFRSNIRSIKSTFSTAAYIAEWSTDQGFDSASAYGNNLAERNWARNLQERLAILEEQNIDQLFFCFANYGGGFGIPANKWGLKLSGGSVREAWYAVAKVRRQIARSSASRPIPADRLITTRPRIPTVEIS